MYTHHEIELLLRQHQIFEKVGLCDTLFNQKYNQIIRKNLWLCFFSSLNASFFLHMALATMTTFDLHGLKVSLLFSNMVSICLGTGLFFTVISFYLRSTKHLYLQSLY